MGVKLFHQFSGSLSSAKKACFYPIFQTLFAVRGAIFKAAVRVALAQNSCYIRGVKQVTSDRLQCPLGSVSILKKWEEPEYC